MRSIGMTLDYQTYLDKVYGCWLGKSISGTIGAPYEGMKARLNVAYDPSMAAVMLPNDDLDLQVLWLEVLEVKGPWFDSRDLADVFYHRVPYAPAEYGVFMKNYELGIEAPMSGTWNNPFYHSGMGCSIRAEIFACASPGNVQRTVEFARRDGFLDHGNASYESEQFMGAVLALAFVEDDINKLLDEGLAQVPSDGRFAAMVRNVRGWCAEKADIDYVRSRLLRRYGHPDCTNMFQNMGIVIAALLLGERDFMKTTILALNCGYDTDSTCAMVGALLGILRGGQSLMNQYHFPEQHYQLTVDAVRRSDKIWDLAEDTARMGLWLQQTGVLPCNVQIINAPDVGNPPYAKPAPTVRMKIDYQGNAGLGIGQTRVLPLAVRNDMAHAVTGTLTLDLPTGWQGSVLQLKKTIAPGEMMMAEVELYIPQNIPKLPMKNIVTVRLGEFGYSFGLEGAAAWVVYGPFWDNWVNIPTPPKGRSYGEWLKADEHNQAMMNMRRYHINAVSDIDKGYLPLTRFDKNLLGFDGDGDDAARCGEMVNIYEDAFYIDDLLTYEGPCVVYMARYIEVEEDVTVSISAGHSDPFRFYLDDELVMGSDRSEYWTGENDFRGSVRLSAGRHKLVLKLQRVGERARFGYLFDTKGLHSKHFVKLASVNPALV